MNKLIYTTTKQEKNMNFIPSVVQKYNKRKYSIIIKEHSCARATRAFQTSFFFLVQLSFSCFVAIVIIEIKSYVYVDTQMRAPVTLTINVNTKKRLAGLRQRRRRRRWQKCVHRGRVHSKTIAKLSCTTYTMRTDDRLIIINCVCIGRESGLGCNIVERHCERLSSDLTTSLRTEPTIFHLERSENVFQASLLFPLSCCRCIDLCFNLCHYIYIFHSI